MTMANVSTCSDMSDAVELYELQGLYLKPVAKMNICIQLPLIKTPGKTISNWEVMEKVKHMIRPDNFMTMKVAKSTLEFIRLEGEIENKSKLGALVAKLDNKTIKLSGFPESMKVKAAEAKVAFPVRHNWDSYFRDAKNMDEVKPGERPDTINVRDLPTWWFSLHEDGGKSGQQKLKPSEDILRRVFETFGEIRCVDIPMLDMYRKEIMSTLATPTGSISTFHYGQDISFEAFVQYKDYIGFVKAMDALRGMKLMYVEDADRILTATIKVDFDRTKHMSDKMIRKRRQERDRLEALEQLRQEQVKKEREDEERKREVERQKKLELELEKQRKKEERQRLKEERRREREQKRRQKWLERKEREEEERMQLKILVEERRLLIAQRKLESLRLLTELFERVKDGKMRELVEKRKAEEDEAIRQEQREQQRLRLEDERQKAEAKIQKRLQMRQQEAELREKILRNVQRQEEKTLEKNREELRMKLSGSHRLKSAVIMKERLSASSGRRGVSSSPSSSSEESSDSSSKKLTNKRHHKGKGSTAHKHDDSSKSGGSENSSGGSRSGNTASSSSSSSTSDDSRPRKKRSSSALDRILKADRLRAWGGEPDGKKLTGNGSEILQTRIVPVKPSARGKRHKILIIKQVPDEEMIKKNSDSSDSSDSSVTVVPPPRSSFAPPDDPINYMHRPPFVRPHWSPFHPRGMMPPPWRGPPPPGFMPPPWFGPRGPRHFRRWRGRSHPRNMSPPPAAPSGKAPQKAPPKLSTKKDTDGRFLYPLT